MEEQASPIDQQRPDHAELIAEMVRRIVSVCDPERIILFGSYARGVAGPDSDMDLLVVTACHHRRETAQRLYQVLAGIGVAKDIVVVTPEDLHRQQDELGSVIYPALREGKVIYAA